MSLNWAIEKQSDFRRLGTFLINAGNIGTIPAVLAWVSFFFFRSFIATDYFISVIE